MVARDCMLTGMTVHWRADGGPELCTELVIVKATSEHSGLTMFTKQDISGLSRTRVNHAI